MSKVDNIKSALANNKKEFEGLKKKYLSGINKEEKDFSFSDIKERKNDILNYFESLKDSKGSINSSPHNKALKDGNKKAILVEQLKYKYDLSLKEINLIIQSDFKISLFCPVCGKRLKNITHQYCSLSCMKRDPKIQEKYEETCMKKYGVKNAAASKEIQEKIKKTNLERRGVEYNFQDREVKDKIKESWMEKYGVDNPNKSKEVRDKICKTNKEKYGVEYTFQAKEVKEKIKEKVDKTRREKKYPLLIEWLKRKNIKMLSTYEEYLNSDILRFLCLDCKEEFYVGYSTYIQYKICCEKCYKDKRSASEGELYMYIKSLIPNEDIIKNSRSVLNGQEIDIYIPKRKIAIEYDGSYWHSSNIRNTDPNYHFNKMKSCLEKGITLIHVFDTEWNNKKDIVKSIIKSKLGIYDNIIYARKCEMKRISDEEYRKFVDLNHLQGYVPSKIKIGLFYNNELVCCGGIGKSRFKNGEIELIRFCTKLNTKVIGGLGKIIKNTGIPEIISYVDRRYFNGGGYEKVGFIKVGESHPGYVYIKGDNIMTRYQCQKHLLPNLLGDIFDENLTEVENMTNAGYYQLYDCGMMKYRYSR